jgi:hypothetical protein
MSDLQVLAKLVFENDDLKVTFSTIGLRRLLSFEKNPPIQSVIDMNLVPRLLTLL